MANSIDVTQIHKKIDIHHNLPAIIYYIYKCRAKDIAFPLSGGNACCTHITGPGPVQVFASESRLPTGGDATKTLQTQPLGERTPVSHKRPDHFTATGIPCTVGKLLHLVKPYMKIRFPYQHLASQIFLVRLRS